MFLHVTFIILLAESCYTQDYMTCSRNTDTFQFPSTLPAPSGGVNQQGKPGKQGPVGLTGPIGPKGMKGEPGIPDDSEIDVLRDRVRFLEEQLNNTLSALHVGHASLGDGWYSPFNGYQYKLITTTQSWQESRSLCQGMGGDLAAVGMRDFDLRMRIANALGIRNVVWIGLSDLASEGNFVWVDGIPSTRENTHWRYAGQPDDYGNNEDCGEIDFNYGFGSNDRSCTDHYGALCQKRLEI